MALAVLGALAVEAGSSAMPGECGSYESQNAALEESPADGDAENTSDFADFICEGTVWEGASITEYDKPYSEQFTTGKDWIEGTEVINSREYMVVRKERKNLLMTVTGKAYIRKSEDKIYAIVPDRLDIGEFVLYDFSLQPGELVVTMPYSGGPGFPYALPIQFRCDETEVINSDGIDFESFVMNVEKTHEDFTDTKIRWIKGIGSECGLLRNFTEQAGSRYKIFNVYHNGELVYSVPDPNASSVDRIIDDNSHPEDGRIYDLSGREVKEGSKGIFVRNGKKFIVR